MNQLTRVEAGLPVSVGTAKLIRASVSDNTLKAYRHALKKLESWLVGRGLDDRLLAEYIAELHTAGRSPADYRSSGCRGQVARSRRCGG